MLPSELATYVAGRHKRIHIKINTRGSRCVGVLTDLVNFSTAEISCSYSPPGKNTAVVFPPSVWVDEFIHRSSRSISSQPYVLYRHTHVSGYRYTLFCKNESE